MTALELLIRIDAVAGLLLFVLSVWLWGVLGWALWKNILPASRIFLTGLSCITTGAAGVVLLNEVRRRIKIVGGEDWWAIDSWGYVFFKILLIIGAIWIIRAFTKRNGGPWVFVLTLVVVLLFLIFPHPADYLGDFVFWVFDRRGYVRMR